MKLFDSVFLLHYGQVKKKQSSNHNGYERNAHKQNWTNKTSLHGVNCIKPFAQRASYSHPNLFYWNARRIYDRYSQPILQQF